VDILPTELQSGEPMPTKHAPQRAYLVRGWSEGESANDGKPIWRFAVEEVLPTRRRTGFSNVAALLAFLRDELDRGAEDEEGEIQNSKFVIRNS
jgi:hypothetical protein